MTTVPALVIATKNYSIIDEDGESTTRGEFRQAASPVHRRLTRISSILWLDFPDMRRTFQYLSFQYLDTWMLDRIDAVESAASAGLVTSLLQILCYHHNACCLRGTITMLC